MSTELNHALARGERLLRGKDYDGLSILVKQLHREAHYWPREECQTLKDSLVGWLEKVSRDRAEFAQSISAKRGKRGALRSYRAELTQR